LTLRVFADLIVGVLFIGNLQNVPPNIRIWRHVE